MAKFLGKTWSKQELLQYVGHMEQLAGIKAVEGGDGAERGARMFQVHTGSGLTFRVLADRALDISACRFNDIPLSWTSSTGEVHPAYYEPEDIRWLRSFPGGLLTTCGLDHFGAPSEDEGQHFGIHGRISNTPAQQVSYRAYWDGDEYRLEISGQMRQSRLYGENLVLYRRITTALGSAHIRLDDTVTNEGFNRQPHMILYHCNLGFPLISENTELRLDPVESIPRDPDAEAGFATWRQFQKPTPDYREQVFRHRLRAGDDGWAAVEIANADLDFGLRIRYDANALPHLVHWKQMGQGAYVLGVEPANSSGIKGRAEARASGDLPLLEPGESRSYSLMFEIMGT
jgi:hypothetical protein